MLARPCLEGAHRCELDCRLPLLARPGELVHSCKPRASNARIFHTPLDVIAKQNDWRLVIHTKAACSPVPVTLWERKLRRVYNECHQWRQKVRNQIARIKPEIVFVGSSRDYELWNGGSVDRVVDSFPLWRTQLTELLTGLNDASGRVVLLAETPFVNFDPVDCLAEDPNPGACDPSRIIVVDANYAAVENDAVAASGTSILSANELLCPERTCPVVVDDMVVFRDNHHLTASYMAQLAGPLSEYLAGRDPLASPVPQGA